eukprot:scaffold128_cov328-Pavlova_lutheri.AAC.33
MIHVQGGMDVGGWMHPPIPFVTDRLMVAFSSREDEGHEEDGVGRRIGAHERLWKSGIRPHGEDGGGRDVDGGRSDNGDAAVRVGTAAVPARTCRARDERFHRTQGRAARARGRDPARHAVPRAGRGRDRRDGRSPAPRGARIGMDGVGRRRSTHRATREQKRASRSEWMQASWTTEGGKDRRIAALPGAGECHARLRERKEEHPASKHQPCD